MRNLGNLLLLILLLTQTTGCVGFDVVHSKTSSSGSPEKIDGAEETTTYSGGYKWAGLYISMIVPIPLIIPYGRESDTRWVKEHAVIYQEQVRTTTSGYGCAIWLECGELITWGHLFLEPNTYH